MIPNIIHYCWYGSDIASNKMASRCMKSWQKLHPEKVVAWTEENCPCNENPFVEKAAQEKAYAFISDYYRLKALYEQGGIYLDTDIEIKKSLPAEMYKEECVFGFMYDNMVSSAFIMAEPHSPVIKGLLDKYEHGEVKQGIANNQLFTDYLLSTYPQFILWGGYQRLDKQVVIYPKEYFECPSIDPNRGFAVHHFMGSWHHKSKFIKLRKFVKLFHYCPVKVD